MSLNLKTEVGRPNSPVVLLRSSSVSADCVESWIFSSAKLAMHYCKARFEVSLDDWENYMCRSPTAKEQEEGHPVTGGLLPRYNEMPQMPTGWRHYLEDGECLLIHLNGVICSIGDQYDPPKTQEGVDSQSYTDHEVFD